MTITPEKRPKILASLPAFSPVASRLLSIVTKEDALLKEVGDVIGMDPALTADVLRLANSPLYGRRYEITTLALALTMLGTNAVRSMALTVVLHDFARSASRAEVFQQCWRHNLACAVLAGDLSAANWMDRDAGYSLGLLHDAGRLALLAASPVHYARLLTTFRGSQTEMLDQERELFEIDHCQLGGLLAERWRLPDDFRRTMNNHHDCEYENLDTGVSLIVHLACDIADMAGFPAWGAPKEWDMTGLQAAMPHAPASILDSGELIPRIATAINLLESTLLL